MPSTYFLSPSTGNNANNGLSSGAAKASLTGTGGLYGIISNGDAIVVKKGDVLPCDYFLDKLNISWGNYGSGANPLFDGFATLTGWTNEGGGLYSKTDASLPSFLNVVLLDGVPVGKRSSITFSTINSHAGKDTDAATYPTFATGTITSTSISGSPSLVGSEVVIRKQPWSIERHKITAHSGTTITYGLLTGHTDAYGYPVNNSYGFFIQNHSSVMANTGDWMYDGATGKLTMYFASGDPSSHTIKVSKAQKFANLAGTGNIFTEIDFQGLNEWAFSNVPSTTQFLSCGFKYIGKTGLYTSNPASSVNINSCSFTDMLSSGIMGDGGSCNSWSVGNNTFLRTGILTGMQGSKDHQGVPVSIFGTNALIEKNNVQESGLYGLQALGDGFIIRKNYVLNSCVNKIDGGAIYTFTGDNNVPDTWQVVNGTQRIIEDNILINTITSAPAGAGSEDKRMGIYLDERASEVTVQRNTVKGFAHSGLFMHNARNITIQNNIFYKNKYGVRLRVFSTAAPSTGITVDSNVIVADAGQFVGDINTQQGSTTTQSTWSNNKYYVPVITNNVFSREINDGGSGSTPRTFTQWKSDTASDSTSSITAKDGNEILEYNATDAAVDRTLSGYYVDTAGVGHSSPINIAAWKGYVLFPSTAPSTGTKAQVKTSGKLAVRGGKLWTRG